MPLHVETTTFIKTFNIQSYLEIGLGDQVHFHGVDIPFKIGISPDANRLNEKNKIIYDVESDIGFQLIQDKKFDLIFIDGLHTYEQAVKDLYSALSLLNDNGIIMMHDVSCLSDKPDYVFDKVRADFKEHGWCGDVWKIIFHIYEHSSLSYLTIIDHDWPGFVVLWKNKSQDFSFNGRFPCDHLTRKYALCNSDTFNATTLYSAIETVKFSRGME